MALFCLLACYLLFNLSLGSSGARIESPVPTRLQPGSQCFFFTLGVAASQCALTSRLCTKGSLGLNTVFHSRLPHLQLTAAHLSGLPSVTLSRKLSLTPTRQVRTE